MDEKHTVDGLDSDSAASKGGEAERGAGGATVIPPHVHMDAMAFGMGCCCLQVTFQVCGAGRSRTMSCHTYGVVP